MSKKKHFPARFPRSANGIRSQETRNVSSRTWWAKRWMSRLEAMGMGVRWGKARVYATSGQVLSIVINGSIVKATVMGARKDPYTITINFREPIGSHKSKILAKLKNEPMMLARLLNNEMPTEIELYFRDEGYDFFPGGRLEDDPKNPPGKRSYDVTTSCSCPDYANPCKHVGAVLILLGEEISRRPLTLLELRGFKKEELFDEE